MESEDQEKFLSNQLKQMCCAKGKETCPKDSANIFYQLGKLYKQRTPDKVSLIQSAALFNAAIARNPDNVEEIEQELQQLCSHVIDESWKAQTVSNVKQIANIKQRFNLFDYSKTIMEKVAIMRQKAKDKLLNIKEISSHLKDEKLFEAEQEKILSVQKMQDEITCDYEAIMKDIHDHCLEVMGKPPCNYTLVGMGSLARKEITPYSDFENVIVLEEGCQHKPNYEQTLEYFRWFSVIFHIILINLRETIIPSVSIPSLNDPTRPEGDWFFDAETTRGICFDGMMPHACKFPLGRTKQTERKSWTTELIRPISGMLEYLTAEESLKNGYHLSDILTKTCYVAGSIEVYGEFNKDAIAKLNVNDSETEKQNIIQQIKEDISSYGTRSSLSKLLPDETFNVKRVIYRSTTLFISALGRIHHLYSSSCFEVLSELAEQSKITEYAKHKLMYSVALACEIRLKVYMAKESQDDWITENRKNDKHLLIEAVGEKSIVNYFQIAHALQFEISRCFHLSHFFPCTCLLNINIFSFFAKYDQANMLLKRVIENLSPKMFLDSFQHFDECLNYLEQTATYADTSDKHRSSFLSKADFESRDRQFHEPSDKLQAAEYLNLIGCQLYSSNRFREASEIFKQSLNLLNVGMMSTDDINFFLATVHSNIGLALLQLNSVTGSLCHFDIALDILRQAATDDAFSEKISFLTMNIGNCYMKTNKFTKALDHFKHAHSACLKLQKDASSINKVSEASNLCGICLMKMQRFTDGISFHENLLHTKNKEFLDQDKLNLIASTSDGNKLLEALQCFKTSFEHTKITSSGSFILEKIAAFHVNTSICLMDMNKVSASIFHLERFLDYTASAKFPTEKQVYEDEVLNSNDINLKSFHDKFNDFCTSFEKSLTSACENNFVAVLNQTSDYLKEFYELLSCKKHKNVNTTGEKLVCAVLLNGIGRNLMEKQKFEEAIRHLKNSVIIFQHITKDEFTDKNLANTFYNLATCLSETNDQTGSALYLEQSLAIYKRISTDDEMNTMVASKLFNIGFHLYKAKRFSESHSHFESSLAVYRKVTIQSCKINEDIQSYINSNLEALITEDD